MKTKIVIETLRPKLAAEIERVDKEKIATTNKKRRDIYSNGSDGCREKKRKKKLPTERKGYIYIRQKGRLRYG